MIKTMKKICAFVMAMTLLAGVTPAYAATDNASSVTKPTVSSQAAILMDANTGEILYQKDADTAYYPASITKIMTALLTIENCNMADMVTFSKTATTNLESGAVTLGLTEGDQISVKDCLYGLLLKSANEVANGLAEHVGGSIIGFADMMNAKAKALGCTNTHFVNPNGLNNTQHYTTAHDMALIARACFNNEVFCAIDKTISYTFPATQNHATTTAISMGHKMLYPSDARYYEGVIGGKTGYTSKAGNTLVTCAVKGNTKLIVVILKSTGTQYTDTKALLDYGFALKQSDSSSGPSPSVTETTAFSSEGPGTTSQNDTTQNSSTGSVTSADVKSPLEGDSGTNSNPANATSGWGDTDGRWYYIKSDGTTKASNERLVIDGYEYWFDADGYMATGWRQDGNGGWFYLRPSFGGMKKSSWLFYKDVWYYLGDDGKMLTDTTTPDGCKVGSDGAWIQD